MARSVMASCATYDIYDRSSTFDVAGAALAAHRFPACPREMSPDGPAYCGLWVGIARGGGGFGICRIRRVSNQVFGHVGVFGVFVVVGPFPDESAGPYSQRHQLRGLFHWS